MAVTEQELYRGYGAKPAPDRAVEGLVLVAVIEARIRELWQWRTWDRTHSWATWTTLRQERTVELRALVKLARKARAIAAPDPLTAAKGYHDWQSGR